jgi:hypothetical protein
MAVTLAQLIVQQTKTELYTAAVAVANALGLPVTSWQAGDPTRAQFHYQSENLAALEEIVVGYIRSRFLDLATGMWLKVKAEQDFDVTVPSATFATADVTLTNASGAVYSIDAGDLTVKSSITDKTYRNTTGGTLGAAGTATDELDLTFVADEAGSDSSAGAGEIDEMVTGLLGVTCSNTLAAVGIDEQDEAVTRQQCRDKLGSLSPNGPKEAYSFVARDPDLAGTNACTRVRVYSDSDTGDVTVYLAGPSGGVAEADRALIEDAILTYATPLCITPSVLAATNVAVAITYEIWIYNSCNRTAAEAAEDIEAALESMFATRPIGGDIITVGGAGYMYQSLIEATIRNVFSQAFRVTVTLPTGDTAIAAGQVATLGTVIANVHLVTDP